MIKYCRIDIRNLKSLVSMDRDSQSIFPISKKVTFRWRIQSFKLFAWTSYMIPLFLRNLMSGT
ncbi:hypothetical protein Leryth_027419 [Lithospermum erythrorhizon]|nr:hypothetical protein Leryth_027419 [Lithospermum erythrorhizon]